MIGLIVFLSAIFIFVVFYQLGMVAHRVTGNKVVSALHKLNHSISYTDVRMRNKKLAQNISSQMKAPKSLMKRMATHVTLDNKK